MDNHSWNKNKIIHFPNLIIGYICSHDMLRLYILFVIIELSERRFGDGFTQIFKLSFRLHRSENELNFIFPSGYKLGMWFVPCSWYGLWGWGSELKGLLSQSPRTTNGMFAKLDLMPRHMTVVATEITPGFKWQVRTQFLKKNRYFQKLPSNFEKKACRISV